MNETTKDVLSETRKWVIGQIVAALGALLLGLSPTIRAWGRSLSLSDNQVSSIQYWLIFLGAVFLIFAACSFFVRTVRKLRSVERNLIDARKRPPRFQDDCYPDEKLPMYHHKTKPGFFCVACAAAKDLETPMQTMEHGWNCPVDSLHFIRNPEYKAPTLPPPQRQPWQRY